MSRIFLIREFDWTTGLPSLSVAGRTFLFEDADYSLDMLSTTGVTKRAEVIFAGYGICAPDKGLDEYDTIDVKDKIVLVLKGAPKDAPKQRRMFSSGDEKTKEDDSKEDWKDESTPWPDR